MKLEHILDIVSHDLKSPLAKIKSHVIVMLHTKPADEKLKKRLTTIDQITSDLNTQLSALLESLYLLSGKKDFLYQFFDIIDLVERISEKAEYNNHITVTDRKEKTISVLADPDAIKKAIETYVEYIYTGSDPVHITLLKGKNKVDIILTTPSVQQPRRPSTKLLLAYEIIKSHGGAVKPAVSAYGYSITIPLKARK